MEERNQASGKPLELTPDMELDETDEPIIELTEVVETAAGNGQNQTAAQTPRDDSIIELEDVVEDREPIIELKEIVETDTGDGRNQTATQTPRDDSIIELEDVVESRESVTGPSEMVEENQADRTEDSDENIFELSEVLEPESEVAVRPEDKMKDETGTEEREAAQQEAEIKADDSHAPAEEFLRAEAQDEETLSGDQKPSAVMQTPEKSPAEDEPAPKTHDEPLETETDLANSAGQDLPEDGQTRVIDLAPNLEAEASPDDKEPGEEIKIGIEQDLVDQEEENIFDDIAENLGLELDEEPEDQELSATAAEIESAIEKVIEKRFGHRIEQLIVETIERAVEAEIERIKRALLDENS